MSIHFMINNGSHEMGLAINILRDLGMNYAITDFVLMLDMDLVLSPGTHQNILTYLPHFYLSN